MSERKNSQSVAASRSASQSELKSSRSSLALGWLERFVPFILVFVGAIGSFASFMLTVEHIQHLKYPAQKLGCDLNPVVGCGTNMDIWQGHVLLGIPNELFGLGVFAAILAVGVAILAGAKLRRWFWLSLQAGLLFGLLSVHWFIFESIYVIGHLCPYCMLTWLAVIIGFWYISLYNIRAGHVRVPLGLAKANQFIQRHHADILALWLLLIVGLILKHFWYYFGQNL